MLLFDTGQVVHSHFIRTFAVGGNIANEMCDYKPNSKLVGCKLKTLDTERV